jgi:hypothetical protein
VHQEQPGARVADRAQCRRNLLLQGRSFVIANPGFEKIAENVELLHPSGLFFKKSQKCSGDVGARLFQV